MQQMVTDKLMIFCQTSTRNKDRWHDCSPQEKSKKFNCPFVSGCSIAGQKFCPSMLPNGTKVKPNKSKHTSYDYVSKLLYLILHSSYHIGAPCLYPLITMMQTPTKNDITHTRWQQYQGYLCFIFVHLVEEEMCHSSLFMLMAQAAATSVKQKNLQYDLLQLGNRN